MLWSAGNKYLHIKQQQIYIIIQYVFWRVISTLMMEIIPDLVLGTLIIHLLSNPLSKESDCIGRLLIETLDGHRETLWEDRHVTLGDKI